MKCPFCGTDEDRVIDSRPARDSQAIRRRRECSACGNRFTTYEAPEQLTVLVIKSDGTREPFDSKKVFRGLSIACAKRPIPGGTIQQITTAVETKVMAAESKEVTSQQIGLWILEELQAVDQVAYVRFASVFKRYENLEGFLTELADMRRAARDPSQAN
jgi:transcriptional repressor NrdR